MNWLLCLLGFHDWTPPSVPSDMTGRSARAVRFCRNPHCSKPTQTLSADGKRWS